MSPKITAALAVIALALGAFVYFVEIGGEADRKAAEQASERLFPDLESETIDAIEFVTLDGIPVRFERSGPGWILPGLESAPADGAAIESLAEALAGLAREGRVADPGSPEAFGFGEASPELTFESEGRAMGLRLGGTTPVGGFQYVTPTAEAELDVSFVESFRLNGFRRNLLDLRERSVAPSLGEVTSLELAWPGSKVVLQKDEGVWRMTAPTEDLADAETVRALLDGMSFLQANGFVDRLDEGAETALAAVAFEVRWPGAAPESEPGSDSDSEKESRILIGDVYTTEQAGGTVSGRIVRTASGRVVTIPLERFEEFERRVVAYRDRTLADFDVTAATGLDVEFIAEDGTEAVVTARREEAGWVGGDSALDTLRMGALLERLSNLRASSILAEEMGPAERAALGLAPPRAHLRILGGDENDENKETLAELVLGRLDERGLYAQRLVGGERESTIFLLEDVTEEELPASWADFMAHYSDQTEPLEEISEAASEDG